MVESNKIYDITIFNKYRIFSFYNMFEFQTKKILPILKIISDISSRLSVYKENSKSLTRIRFEEDEKIKILNDIDVLLIHLKELNFNMSTISVEKLNSSFEGREPCVIINDDIILIEEIHQRVIDELSLKKLLVIDSLKEEYYNPKGSIFGQNVLNSFPSCEFNIVEAGNCFALSRYTACVFHLMRALETPIKAFAQKLDLDIDNRANWSEILKKITKSIDRLDNKQIKEKYHSIVAYFPSIKTGWRNYTMHGNSKFTEEETKAMLEVCKVIMQELSKHFKED